MTNALEKANPAALMSFGEMERASEMMATSKLLPSWDTKEKIMSLMLLCRAEGSDPVTAVNRYDNIQGRVTKKPKAMLQDFLAMGGKVKWIEKNTTIAKAEFTTPQGDKHTDQFTIEDAQRAGLTGKDVWKKYTESMLTARCISKALNSFFPSATGLLYTPEEMESVHNDPPKPKQRNTVPVNIHRAEEPKSAPVDIPETSTDGEIEVENTAGIVDEADAWSELLKAMNEAEMIVYCQSIGWLSEGQTMAELPQGKKDKIIEKQGSFLVKVAKHIQALKEEKEKSA